MTTLHAIIHGRVQGVSFRYSTLEEALRLGLTGWVRNRHDEESVEVSAAGERKTLEQLLAWLHHGPSGARVVSVDYSWDTAPDEGSDYFEIR
ncbi:MAG TPA: acylphosphatase [Aggregatilineales bacterium]|nr:acylphosphatase [Aggregatilineales bacterium]